VPDESYFMYPFAEVSIELEKRRELNILIETHSLVQYHIKLIYVFPPFQFMCHYWEGETVNVTKKVLKL
jgi:hypothetical protein